MTPTEIRPRPLVRTLPCPCGSTGAYLPPEETYRCINCGVRALPKCYRQCRLCDRLARCKGLCARHYERSRKHGDPLGGRKYAIDPARVTRDAFPAGA